jgi:hypothetical protein
MIGSNGRGLLVCRCDESASCRVVGLSEQASGALLNGRSCCVIEEAASNPDDFDEQPR